jgi:sodium-dependent dicarboxylate transporter 2/3/5
MAFKKLALFVASLFCGWVAYLLCDGLSSGMRLVFAIFLIAVILWITEWIPLFLTSFVILLLECVLLNGKLGGNGIGIFFEPFFSPIITLFLGGFALSHAMHKFQLDQMIAVWIFGKSGGDPRKLISFLLVICAFISMWISNAATTLLMMMVVLPVLRRYEGKSFCKAVLLAIPIGATIGGMSTPMGTPPNAVAINALTGQGISVSFLHWLTFSAPICAVLLIIAKLGLELFFSVDNTETIELKEERRVQWSGEAIGVLAIFIITTLLWLTSPIHHIQDGIVALVPFILLYLTRLLKPADLKEMGWDTLLLVGGGMSLGTALKESGVAQWVVQEVTGGSFTLSGIVMVIAVITLALSIFISDTVATSITIPLAVALPLEPVSVVMIVTLASSVAVVLPTSSPANAIVFSSGNVRSWDMLRIGGLISIAGILVLFLAYWVYWPWVHLLVSQ